MYEYPFLIQVLRPVIEIEEHMQVSGYIKIEGFGAQKWYTEYIMNALVEF